MNLSTTFHLCLSAYPAWLEISPNMVLSWEFSLCFLYGLLAERQVFWIALGLNRFWSVTILKRQPCWQICLRVNHIHHAPDWCLLRYFIYIDCWIYSISTTIFQVWKAWNLYYLRWPAVGESTGSRKKSVFIEVQKNDPTSHLIYNISYHFLGSFYGVYHRHVCIVHHTYSSYLKLKSCSLMSFTVYIIIKHLKLERHTVERIPTIWFTLGNGWGHGWTKQKTQFLMCKCNKCIVVDLGRTGNVDVS